MCFLRMLCLFYQTKFHIIQETWLHKLRLRAHDQGGKRLFSASADIFKSNKTIAIEYSD
jgi:hypothetical protein